MAEEDAEVEVQAPETGVGKFLFGTVEDIEQTYNGEWKMLKDGTKVRHGKGTQIGVESYEGSWEGTLKLYSHLPLAYHYQSRATDVAPCLSRIPKWIRQ